MSARPRRWGLLGSGDVVRKRVEAALTRNGRQLAAAWSPSLAVRDGLSPTLRAARRSTPGEVIAESEAIYVASPVDSHMAYTLAALEAGRHVIVEKPLSAGLGDAAAVWRAAVRQPRHVLAAYYRRYGPWGDAVRTFLDSGELGRLEAVEVEFSTPYAEPSHGPGTWRWQPERGGGGVLADAGCHRLDLLVGLLGLPSDAEVAEVQRSRSGVETNIEILATWSGVKGRCRFDWRGPERDEFTFRFANGNLAWTRASPDTWRAEMRAGAQTLQIPPVPCVLEPLLRVFDDSVASDRDPLPALAHDLAFDGWLTGVLAQARIGPTRAAEST